MTKQNINIEDIDAVLGIMNTNSTSENISTNANSDLKIDDIDAIIRVLNATSKTNSKNIVSEEVSEVKEEDCELAAKITVGATKRSTGNHGKINTKNEKDVKIIPSEKTLLKTCLSVSIVSLAVLIELNTGIKTIGYVFDAADKVQDTIQNIKSGYSKYIDTNKSVNLLEGNARQTLINYGLAHMVYSEPRPFQVLNNSVESYKRLQADDIVDVYTYKQILDETEFSKFIKSVSYIDTEGNYCYYVDFDQFLRINGFPDEKTFENYARNDVYELYLDGQLYVFDINNQAQGRGGL